MSSTMAQHVRYTLQWYISLPFSANWPNFALCGERERIFQVSIWNWTRSLHIQLKITLTPIDKLNTSRIARYFSKILLIYFLIDVVIGLGLVVAKAPYLFDLINSRIHNTRETRRHSNIHWDVNQPGKTRSSKIFKVSFEPVTKWHFQREIDGFTASKAIQTKTVCERFY